MSGRLLRVEADGGSRGNPGPAGYGALVRDPVSGEVLAETMEAIGTATNNVAEYRGLVAGLRAAQGIDPGARVEVAMDSKLVVEQMSGRWKIKHADMRTLAAEAGQIARSFPSVSYRWMPRAQNAAADALANQAMDAAAHGGEPSPSGAAAARPARAREQGLPGDRGEDLGPARAWGLLAEDPRAVLVDVRTEPEWVLVGTPDLTGLGKRVVGASWSLWGGGANPRFLEEIDGVPRDAPVLFLCRSGHRSAAAADAAAEAGWLAVHNVAEGFEGDVDEHGHRGAGGWKAAGLPWRQG